MLMLVVMMMIMLLMLDVDEDGDDIINMKMVFFVVESIIFDSKSIQMMFGMVVS